MSSPRQFEILVVDDDDDIRSLIASMLGARFHYVNVTNIEEAISHILNDPPDLIFSDHKMAGGSGLDLLESLREKKIMIPFVFITAYGDKELVIEALRLGAFDFIEKPFTLAQITKTVDRAYTYLGWLKDSAETKAKSAEAEKLASIGLMTSSVIHEVANAVVALIGRLDRMKKFYDQKIIDPEGGDDLLKQTQGVAERLIRLLKGFNSMFARSADNPESLKVFDIVEDAIAICQDRFIGSGILFERAEIPQSANVYCDQIEISSALINLLINAMHAIEGGQKPRISMAFAEEKSFFRVSVIDNGKGVSKEYQEKIFETFFTTKKPGKGTGLGLATSRRLVERNGGKLELDKNYTRGAKFDILLPKK